MDAAGSGAARAWADALAAWAIPPEILENAPEPPWCCMPDLFRAPPSPGPDTPSRQRAVEALDGAGTVIDVGVGGGAASLALVPHLTEVTGVDQSRPMLDAFVAAAQERGVAAKVVEGLWPEVGSEVGSADVVVSHNVLYNVADLPRFLSALSDHARRRVVIQISAHHPRARLAAAWKYFWGSDLPGSPTADDALRVAREMGIAATLERFQSPRLGGMDRETEVVFARRQLCLGPEADPDIDRLLPRTDGEPRESACIWWDVLADSDVPVGAI